MTAYTAVRPLRRPEGAPRPDDFTFVSGEIPALAAGQFLVENLLLSVDPYHREYMEWGGWERGFGLEGRAIGRVVESRNPALPEGTIVFHRHGWSTHALLGPEDAHRVLVPAEGVPLSAYLGVLGGTGLTAYVALTRIARLQPGEDLFISSAAGGVGSAAGQIARVMGVGRMLGSTGSPGKVKHLTDRLGFDVGLDYRAGDLAEQLANAAPTGVDVYFDNVGGEHLEAAIAELHVHGRVAVCGMISVYNATEPTPAPRNLPELIKKRLTLRGMLVLDHANLREEFQREVGGWLREGKLQYRETVVEGIRNAPEAMLGLLRGDNTGKMLVKIA